MKRLIVAVLAATVGMLTSLTVGAGGTAHAAALEMIAVPSNGNAVLSTTSLASGTTYWIRASGAMFIGTVCSQPDADAEYYCFDSPTDVCTGLGPAVDNGVGINDSIVDSVTFPSWGSYDPTHVYTVAFVGEGAPISLNYHDCVYGDNSGCLTVEIWPAAPSGVPPTASCVAVGGIAEQPDMATLPSVSASSGGDYTVYILGSAAVLALGATGAIAAHRRRRPG